MYTIKINDEEITNVEDYAVVNLDGEKTLYIRASDGKQMGYELGQKHALEIMVKE